MKIDMADSVISLLSYLADYSNVLAVFMIVLCFFLTSIFIIRLNGEHRGNRRPLQPGSYVPMQAMCDVHNPFLLQLINSSDASFHGGVELLITSTVEFHMCMFWGADIAATFHLMNQSWIDLVNMYRSGQLLKEHSLEHESRENLTPCANYVQKVQPYEKHVDLGDPPRSRYPLVVLLLPAEQESPAVAEETMVAMMLTTVHVKDEICVGESHIIGQYIRTAQGRPCNLKQLYVASEQPPELSTMTPCVSECVVCQTAPVSQVLLPCRHACVCASCFIKIDRCPICRALIHSHFSLSPDDEPQGSVDMEDDNETWFYRWNRRLNEYLGFM